MGNGSDNRDLAIGSSTGVSPDVVLVKRSFTSPAVIRTSAMSGDLSKPLTIAGALTANYIQAFGTDTFQVGTDFRVNENLRVYWFMALFDDGAGDLAVGSYAGSDDNSRVIDGVGFQPDMTMVMGSGAVHAVVRSSVMGANICAQFNMTIFGYGINDEVADGFTIGDIRYLEGDLGVTGEPDFDFTNMAIGDVIRIDDEEILMGTPSTRGYNGTTAAAHTDGTPVELITGGQPNDTRVNASGATYYWICVKKADYWFTPPSSYTGNDADNRSIALPAPTFQPIAVWVLGLGFASPFSGAWRVSNHATDASSRFSGTADQANEIQAFEAAGFQIGSADAVNDGALTYIYFAWGDGTVPPSAAGRSFAMVM